MPLKARLLWSKKHIRGGRSNAANDPATDLRGSLLRGRSAASVHGSDNSVVLAVRLLLYMEPLCLQPAEADITAQKGDSHFDVVDGARSRRRIAVR